MRAVIYTRVSTIEQSDGYSLDAQLEVCRTFCAGRKWQVIRVYQDAGISARTDERPAFQQMIADGDYDVIVCHKLDRFSRSLLDVMSYLSKLNERGITFASATEDFDFSTPFGKVVLAMLAAFAQWYLDNLSAEVAKAAEQRHREGHWLGNLAFGYTTPRRLLELLQSDDITPELKEGVTALLDKYANLIDTAAVPCPLTSGGVQLAFELYAAGKSYEQVADALNAAGYRSNTNRSESNLFTMHTVRDLLQNRFYLGEIARAHHNVHTTKKARRDARQWMPGAHDPIITPELFDRVQQRRASKKHQSRDPVRYALSGVLVDRTGVRWHGSSHIDKRARYLRSAYEAKRNQAPPMAIKSVRADDIEAQIQQILSYISIPQESINDAIRIMRNTSTPLPRPDFDITAKQNRLKALYIDGIITKQEFTERWQQLTPPVPTTPTSGFSVEEVDALLHQLSDAAQIWQIAQEDERIELIRLLFSRVVVDVVDKQIKIVEVQPASTLCHILDNLSHAGWGWWDSNPIYVYIPSSHLIRRQLASAS